MIQLRSPMEAARTALFVGITLSLINQSALLTSSHWEAADILKIGMNFLVPFTVASYSQRVCIRKIQKLTAASNHEK